MNKKYLKVALMGAMAVIASGMFTSCEKDDKDTVVTNPLVPNTDGSATLTVIVENGNSYNSTISTAKIFIKPDGGDDVEIVSGNYANGGFTINLPATLNDSIVEINLVVSENFTVSDGTAKVTGLRTSFRIYGYNNSAEVGRFYCKSGDYDVKLFYADKDVNISGQILREDRNDSIYNLSLKKGWNLVYVLETSDTYEVTTTSQGELKWTLNS
ncbi:hypothetical protein FACS1894195_2040 [Bacteroidia bacterium]|nr:hypothetical protein FACS1894195_2040 [Bacteroidia bacterium]